MAIWTILQLSFIFPKIAILDIFVMEMDSLTLICV